MPAVGAETNRPLFQPKGRRHGFATASSTNSAVRDRDDSVSRLAACRDVALFDHVMQVFKRSRGNVSRYLGRKQTGCRHQLRRQRCVSVPQPHHSTVGNILKTPEFLMGRNPRNQTLRAAGFAWKKKGANQDRVVNASNNEHRTPVIAHRREREAQFGVTIIPNQMDDRLTTWLHTKSVRDKRSLQIRGHSRQHITG
ncbi:MAG: hypothetical protein AAGJ28_03340 [Pseudomonadota bacterium]